MTMSGETFFGFSCSSSFKTEHFSGVAHSFKTSCTAVSWNKPMCTTRHDTECWILQANKQIPQLLPVGTTGDFLCMPGEQWHQHLCPRTGDPSCKATCDFLIMWIREHWNTGRYHRSNVWKHGECWKVSFALCVNKSAEITEMIIIREIPTALSETQTALQ